MKQKDIALIIVVVAISAVASFFLSKLLFTSQKERSQKVEVVDVITPEFTMPDSKYFNERSINPTQLIRIGETTNPTPFNGGEND
jgi:hypothetical protein